MGNWQSAPVLYLPYNSSRVRDGTGDWVLLRDNMPLGRGTDLHSLALGMYRRPLGRR